MKIESIAIVGASELGRQLAYQCVVARYRTILEDVSLSTLEQGLAWIAEALGCAVLRGEIGAAVREVALAKLTTASTPEDASREADLIIETVSDEIEMKI